MYHSQWMQIQFHHLFLPMPICRTTLWWSWSQNRSTRKPFKRYLACASDVQASEDAKLSCTIEYNNDQIAQFNQEQNLWRLLFASERAGLHKSTGRLVRFSLIYTHLHTKKYWTYSPIVAIDWMFHDATGVNMKVDSQCLKSEGYTDSVLRRQITVAWRK